MDIDTIEPGEDFVTVIHDAVASCEILLAVIGRNWVLGSGGGTGRLDNPNDFVRLEIGAALSRDIRVIPVLVQRASMPRTQDLPDDLSKLLRRNAIELSDLRWQNDVSQLISVMERVLARREEAETQHALDLRREEENRARAEEEHLRQAAEESERQVAEQALHSNSQDEQTQPELAAAGNVVSSHEAQPPDSSPLLDNTSATTIRQSRSKRTMIFATIGCIAVLATVAVIWLTHRPEGNQQPANLNATIAVAQPTEQPTATPKQQPTVSPGLKPDALANLRLGNQLFNEKKYPEAESYYRAALLLHPTSAEYNRHVSMILRKQEKYKDAEYFARKAWRREPNSPESNNELGLVLMGLENYHDAESFCHKAVDLNPDNAAFHSDLGDALLWLDRKADAKTQYEKAIEKDPTNVSYKERLEFIRILELKL